MKKIIVFDVPAESGGALTILNQFHEKALIDEINEYIFVTGKVSLLESKNVKNIQFPWIKKSWFHRLFFDDFLAHRVVKDYEADEVLSLQNVSIKKTNIPQSLYVHQPLPFVDRQYKLTENLKFWIYQNIISKRIYKSAQQVDKIIVQTEWFKKEVIKRAGVSGEKITIQPPKINIKVERTFISNRKSTKTFFYPSSSSSYKNHEVIFDAVFLLKEQGLDDFEVVFTLDGDEDKKIRKMFELVKYYDLPIKFIGSIPYDEVLKYYSRSVLIFPSHIETFGLPLLEAVMHKTIVIASDYPFSREILKNYDESRLIDANNPREWAYYINLISTTYSCNR